MATGRRFRHVPALDGLRGVAVVLVVLSHADTTLPDGRPVPLPYRLLHGGFLGVDLFFVLSGFLITALLLEEANAGGVRPGAFYARRALRLLPALYLFLAVHAVYAWRAGLHAGNERSSILRAVLYVSNWQSADRLLSVSDGMGHLWSLAVEEQFYLGWPLLLVLLLAIDPRRRALPWVLSVAVVGIGIHRAVLWQHGLTWIPLFVRTDTRADALLLGALGAVLWHRGAPARPERLATTGTVAALLALVIVLFARHDLAWMYLGGLTAFAICAGLVVVAVAETDSVLSRALAHPGLRRLGRVSYGLYLWHLLVFSAVRRWVDPAVPVVPRLLLALAISAGCTAISWTVVERPALRMKRRFTAPSA